MSRLFLCVGSYAQTPYWVDKSELNLYSIEELCYYIRENVVLMDKDFIDVRLAEWIEKECKLQKLGQELMHCVNQKDSLTIFINKILRATNYCSEEELARINQQLLDNEDLNNWDKKLRRLDFYYKKGKYAVALREYENLREEVGEEDKKLAARISYNIGTIYAHLFMFDLAAASYLRSYQEEESEARFFAYLAAKRMLLSDKEYIDFIAQEISHYNISLQLEKAIENLNLLWEESEEKQMLEDLQDLRKNQRIQEYCDAIELRTDQQKNEYRENVLNSRR